MGSQYRIGSMDCDPFNESWAPAMGFLRNTEKLSARSMRNRANLRARISSSSSSCLRRRLTRTELTDVSIITDSCCEQNKLR